MFPKSLSLSPSPILPIASWTGVLTLLCLGAVSAHPAPDVPVRSYFSEGGVLKVRVEVDTRCFAEEPTTEPYLQYWVLQEMTPEQREAELAPVAEFLKKTLELRTVPGSPLSPTFKFEFKKLGDLELEAKDDPVVIVGEWNTKLPTDATGYQLHAFKEEELAVQFLNYYNGKPLERIAVLFPGETSFVLELAKLAEAPVQPEPAAPPTSFLHYFKEGYAHVLPRGLDHILFVLGIFLLSREWKPLVWQALALAGGHLIALGLATVTQVSVSSMLAIPIFAVCILAVSAENILHPRFTLWRLTPLFLFGLIHGLLSAGGLREANLSAGTFAVGLLGSNLGVVLAQVTLLALVSVVVVWPREPETYRKYVVLPGSILVGIAALFWMILRMTQG